MTDPIQHLRELMAKATSPPWVVQRALPMGAHIESRPEVRREHWRHVGESTLERDANLIVALRNAAPALLAVAEAARVVLKNNQGPCDLVVHIRDMLALQHALAKLDEVKHD